MKNEIKEKVNNERERLNNIHKNEKMEEQEIKIKQLLEEQKNNFENQNDKSKKQLEKQIKLNKLKIKVENSSKRKVQIVNKYQMKKRTKSISS